LLENYANEIKRDQEEAGQKDYRKLCDMQNVTLRNQLPRKGPQVDSETRAQNLTTMSGDCAEQYKLTAGNWGLSGSWPDSICGRFRSSIPEDWSLCGLRLFRPRETSPKARWCSLALALPLKPTTSPQWTICLRGSKREVAIGVWTWPLGHPRVASVIEARTRDK
jgi:hypothetical protein